jgi:hypothetical protein
MRLWLSPQWPTNSLLLLAINGIGKRRYVVSMTRFPCLSGGWRPVLPFRRLGRACGALASRGAGWLVPTAMWAAGPAELAGSGNELAVVLERVPTGRLVVLGEPGSGKTILMVRLTRGNQANLIGRPALHVTYRGSSFFQWRRCAQGYLQNQGG